MNEDFSLIECTAQTFKDLGVSARAEVDLETANAQPGMTTRFTGTTSSLLAWCRNVETTVISTPLRTARVYAGFERFSLARFVSERYQELGGVAQELHLFGLPDAEIEFPTTQTHPIHAGPLLGEWFLIVRSEEFVGLLSARDLDGFDSSCPLNERRFEGFITHHPKTIERVVTKLTEAFEID